MIRCAFVPAPGALHPVQSYATSTSFLQCLVLMFALPMITRVQNTALNPTVLLAVCTLGQLHVQLLSGVTPVHASLAAVVKRVLGAWTRKGLSPTQPQLQHRAYIRSQPHISCPLVS